MAPSSTNPQLNWIYASPEFANLVLEEPFWRFFREAQRPPGLSKIPQGGATNV